MEGLALLLFVKHLFASLRRETQRKEAQASRERNKMEDVSCSILHVLSVFCSRVVCDVTNKTHHLVFIFSQLFTIDCVSRDLLH